MKVKIVNKSKYPSPAYATEYSAGMDLKANIEQPVILGSLDRAMIPTGLFIEGLGDLRTCFQLLKVRRRC